jgi:hypothetical protein
MTGEKSALAIRRGEHAHCSRCGATFSCGAFAGEADGECWCAALPPLAAAPDPARGCLCPQCLRAALAETGRVSG